MTPLTREQPPYFVDREVLLLSREGTWLSNGEEVTHQGSVEAFHRSIQRDKDGYFLQIGNNTKRVEVEDTAFFVHRLEGDPHMGYEVWLNDGMKVSLDPGTLAYKPGRLSCQISTRIGVEEARFLRGPYFELLSHLQEDEQAYFLNFGGSRVVIAKK